MKDGFVDSPLYLNRTLAKLDTWNETEINNRAKTLADIAIKVWTFPSVDLNNSIHSQNTSNQNNYERYLQGETLQLFEALQKEILNLNVSIKEEFKKKYMSLGKWRCRSRFFIFISDRRYYVSSSSGFPET